MLGILPDYKSLHQFHLTWLLADGRAAILNRSRKSNRVIINGGLAMRVLVMGSSRDIEQLKDKIDKAGRELGKELAERGHTILVGSDDPIDVDPSVVRPAGDHGHRWCAGGGSA